MSGIKAVMRKILKTSCRFFFSPFAHKTLVLDPVTARKNLATFSPKPKGCPSACNKIVPVPVCDLQIIIPAYNVEKWLEDCMESILRQKTKYSYKVVLINDGSTDNTSFIANRYADDERVIVIHQQNAGLSGARNTGLKTLFGKYIMFVDSDDMLCPNAIDALLDTAFNNDSDLVVGGAYSFRKNTQCTEYSYPKTKQHTNVDPRLPGFAWGKVFKAALFESIAFPEGYWFEDSIMGFLIHPMMKNTWVINEYVYLYRKNPQGISSVSKGRSKSLDTYWITEMLLEHRNSLNLPVNQAFLEKYIRQIVLNHKRLAKLPEYIQQSVFVLSAEMMMRYFDEDLIQRKKHDRVVQSLLSMDWGMYKLYCLTA